MDFNENWKCKRTREMKKGLVIFKIGLYKYFIMKRILFHLVIQIKNVFFFYIQSDLLRKNMMEMDIIIGKISAIHIDRIVYTS